MAYKPIESHEEYLKNLEHYRKIKKNAWQSMTLEEKITCMASTMPELLRFGIDMSYVGGEAAHGVEARNDQNGRNIPEPTTSFPQPIGMSASWDTELIKKAGEVTGTEARVLWHRHPAG